MPVILQICLVAVTAGLVVLVVVAVRALKRFERANESISETLGLLRVLLADATHTSGEVRDLARSLGAVSESVRGIAGKFEAVSDRAVAVSSAVLDEVEAPVRSAVGVVRGVRTGTAVLLRKWASRYETAKSNGG